MMPVEIRELQITTVVSDGGGQTSSGNAEARPVANLDIVAACVEQVLEILKQKSER
jgi:hypothetical protein